MRHINLSVFLAAVVLSGCESSAVRESTAVQDNLGTAVADMRRAQTSNPATLAGSQDHAVEGLDPDSATQAIESMRKDTPERAAIKRDIMINVGTQNGGGGNQ